MREAGRRPQGQGRPGRRDEIRGQGRPGGALMSVAERDALRLFVELDEKKKPFTLMHCYIEFEKYPKWQTHPPPQKKHKKTSDASPCRTSNDEDFEVCTDTLEEEIRPPGTKKEKKECLLKDSACKLSLENVWAQKIEKDDAKEVIYMDHIDIPRGCIVDHTIDYSLPRASFVKEFTTLIAVDTLEDGFGKRPFSSTTPYATTKFLSYID
ncbi:hypothetical protein ZWY2020_044609 [Hordeum vulgare]|nr:hypothetical protein ZWY2020_044609 [Hordeum vulgare]